MQRNTRFAVKWPLVHWELHFSTYLQLVANGPYNRLPGFKTRLICIYFCNNPPPPPTCNAIRRRQPVQQVVGPRARRRCVVSHVCRGEGRMSTICFGVGPRSSTRSCVPPFSRPPVWWLFPSSPRQIYALHVLTHGRNRKRREAMLVLWGQLLGEEGRAFFEVGSIWL